MTVLEHIDRLNNLIKHGLDPKSEVLAWDPDMEEWLPVTGILYGGGVVKFYTDEA